MRRNIALIHKDTGSDYGVSFPDLPGWVTAGVDLDDARRMAAEALARRCHANLNLRREVRKSQLGLMLPSRLATSGTLRL